MRDPVSHGLYGAEEQVQFVGMPSWWAVLWMERYLADSLPLQILSLTPSTSISAPPPGSESRPSPATRKCLADVT